MKKGDAPARVAYRLTFDVGMGLASDSHMDVD